MRRCVDRTEGGCEVAGAQDQQDCQDARCRPHRPLGRPPPARPHASSARPTRTRHVRLTGAPGLPPKAERRPAQRLQPRPPAARLTRNPLGRKPGSRPPARTVHGRRRRTGREAGSERGGGRGDDVWGERRARGPFPRSPATSSHPAAQYPPGY